MAGQGVVNLGLILREPLRSLVMSAYVFCFLKKHGDLEFITLIVILFSSATEIRFIPRPHKTLVCFKRFGPLPT